MHIRQITQIVKESKNVQMLYDKLVDLLNIEISQKEKEIYLKGANEALKQNSHWENGVLYIGKTKLSEAINNIKNALDKV